MIAGPVCFRLICASALARVSPREAAEGIVMRLTELSKFGFAVLVAAGIVILAAPAGVRAQTQDAQPSVADAARAAAAAKKDKSAAKTVITEDSLGSGAALTSKTGGAAAAGTTQTSASGAASSDAAGGGMNSASLDAAWARLQATEASLDQLEPMGKSEVATRVLAGTPGISRDARTGKRNCTRRKRRTWRVRGS